MKRIFSVLCFCFLLSLLMPETVLAASNVNGDTSNVDWNPVMNAIIQVESQGHQFAKNGNSCGVLQITPLLVRECNSILKRRKSKKKFKLSDRFNISKSKEMFLIIQSFYNPTNSIEIAIRTWNGGVHYSMARTQRYFEKVMRYIK
ncbi:MAG: lytic transglycosylase domain-containing protein [Bacteroidaceae bacterium]|nr:lytic transglycosylase domain-containing protein [Bacteroidaceae bacterium]